LSAICQDLIKLIVSFHYDFFGEETTALQITGRQPAAPGPSEPFGTARDMVWESENAREAKMFCS
jgi:hypothetical protein